MNRIATNHMLMPVLSRLMSRGARTRAGVRVAGSRVVAAFLAAAVLFGAQTSARFESAHTADAVHGAASTLALPALQTVANFRVAIESRSPSPVPVGAALPPSAYDGLPVAFASRAVTSGAVEQLREAMASRGYDATAPPALS